VDPATPAIDDPSSSTPQPAKQRKLSHRILSGGAWSLVGRIGSMGSLFLMTAVMARLPKAELSAYLTAASIVPLLAMLATLGVPLTLVRVLRAENTDVHRRREAISGAMKLTAMGSAATAAGYWLASGLFPTEPQWQVLRGLPEFVAGWVALSALCMVAAFYLQAEDDFRAAALVGARNGGLIPNGLALAGVAAFAALGALKLSHVLSVQVAAYAISLAAGVWFIGRTLVPSSPPGSVPPVETRVGPALTAWWYFAESWPNLLNQVIGVILAEVDLFWIACLSNDAVVADYGVIRSLRLLVSAPLLVASVALPPFVAELYGRGDMDRLERLVRGSATVLALPSLAALLVLLAAPTPIIRLVYGNAFVEAAPALQILVVGAIVFVLTGNNGMVLTMTGRHRDLLVCSFASLVLYIAISPPLVAAYGVAGAAAAFTIQTVVQNLLVTIRVKQTVGIWTFPFTSWSAARRELESLRQRAKRPH
jgi:O-antigen/teichoic acid export membrane protein